MVGAALDASAVAVAVGAAAAVCVAASVVAVAAVVAVVAVAAVVAVGPAARAVVGPVVARAPAAREAVVVDVAVVVVIDVAVVALAAAREIAVVVALVAVEDALDAAVGVAPEAARVAGTARERVGTPAVELPVGAVFEDVADGVLLPLREVQVAVDKARVVGGVLLDAAVGGARRAPVVPVVDRASALGVGVVGSVDVAVLGTAGQTDQESERAGEAEAVEHETGGSEVCVTRGASRRRRRRSHASRQADLVPEPESCLTSLRRPSPVQAAGHGAR